MELFIVVIAILFLQVWGAENPLHQDAWFTNWMQYVEKNLANTDLAMFFLVVLLPVAAFFLVSWYVAGASNWLLLPIGVFVLLYSFGRGEFSEPVNYYAKSCVDAQWEVACEKAQALDIDTQKIEIDDWQGLHQQVLEAAAYRGFERMFAVLFWFLVLGPIGALAYRLVFLFRRSEYQNATAKKLLWYMEWPAARVLGLSFAFTGNFVGCMHHWKESVLCMTRPTEMTVAQSVLGALSVDEELKQTCEVTSKELSLLDRLYRRTLWFWLAMAAIIILIG